MTHYNRTESLLIRLNDGRVEGNKEENQDHGKPFGAQQHHPDLPTGRRGGSARERGPVVRLAPGGDTGQWPETALNPATASKGRQVPVPSRSTVPWPTPLPAREPGWAQDTRDPGPAVPWRQEQLAHVRTRLEGDPETPGVPPSLPPKSKRRGVTHLR